MDKKIKKILITGSSGTIGTRLFEKLLEGGYSVFGFDKKENKWHKKINNLTIIGDLLNKKDIEKLPKDFDLIIHLAANARVYKLVLNPNLALENILTIYNILDFARRNKIKNIIFSSSREVYGNREKIVSSENEADMHLCESAYSASKISGEALIYSFSKCYKMDYIVCRFSNVFGMYDESERFIPLMIKKMRKNEDIFIYGKSKILDFTYIDDCVSGIIKCVDKFLKVKNNTFNIASGKGEKILDVAKIIRKKLDSKSRIIFKNNLQGEIVKFTADISKAKKLLGYKPQNFIEKSIDKTIDWYKNNLWT